MRVVSKRSVLLGAIVLLAGGVTKLEAGPVTIANPFGSFQVEAKSLSEISWETVVPQQYDFSCGSAAVATLLTFHYDRKTTEVEVFESMIRRGDAERIQTYGFSMLDMKRYLDAQGLNSDGFQISLDDFMRIGVPAITLIDTGGYKHFVVVKGVDRNNVLVGDPAAGTVVVPRDMFQTLWTGTVLGARAELEVAQKHFNSDRDWRVRPPSPIDEGVQRYNVGANLLSLPGINELGR